jgi:hypothetical protein
MISPLWVVAAILLHYMGPGHHIIACPWIVDGGDSLQIWRVTPNRLNKQLQVAERDGPPAWRLGMGLTTPHHKKTACYRMSHGALDLENGYDICNM